MTGIYLITNMVNGKYYVGQSIDIESRWQQHRTGCYNPNSSSYKTYFYQAIRKYGINNFSFSVIEECDEKELDEREIYWIALLNSNQRDIGYNITDGGDGVKGYWDKPVYQYDLNGIFITEYKSASEAKRQTGITTIVTCCCGITKSGGGYLWSYVKYDKLPKYTTNYPKTEVHQYGLNGEYIQSFSSIKEASITTGVCLTSITLCVQNDTQIRAGDYMWTKVKVPNLTPYKRNGRKKLPVLQMDFNNNIIAYYESINEASRATGVNAGHISRCCRGGAKSSGGYCWKYDKE